MISDAKSIISWALETVADLPEKYQVAAFAELLRYALRLESASAAQAEVGQTPPSGLSVREGLVGGLPNDHLVADHGSRSQQAVWAVIRLCQGGQEATSTSVRESIRVHLGETPESKENTSATLRRLAPKYLTRHKRDGGQGYAYTPTARALDVFQGLGEAVEE